MQLRILHHILLASLISLPLGVASAKGPAWTKPVKAKKDDPDFSLQGEYSGTLEVEGGMKIGAQIIALGKGKFGAQFIHGGLPGEGAVEKLPMVEAKKKPDGSVLFSGDQADGLLKDGSITILYNGEEIGTLKKVERKSKTLRHKPPKDAIVLFAGKSTDKWSAAVLDKRLLAFDPKGPGATSKDAFGSHTLHIEFRLPYMPESRGQGRGNSGIYLQGRYEVQMLDSFGLSGADNECGGIYKIAKPKHNMCFPPLAWQTYDIDFVAAEYNDDGEVIKHPRMTVKHNGVEIHKDLELPHHTTAAPRKAGPEDGPVYLQNHGNPVRYRNIWVVKNPRKSK